MLVLTDLVRRAAAIGGSTEAVVRNDDKLEHVRLATIALVALTLLALVCMVNLDQGRARRRRGRAGVSGEGAAALDNALDMDVEAASGVLGAAQLLHVPPERAPHPASGHGQTTASASNIGRGGPSELVDVSTLPPPPGVVGSPVLIQTLGGSGRNGSELPLAAAASDIRAQLSALPSDFPVLLLHASTGAGKSKVVPSFLVEYFQSDVLAITPAVEDMMDMHAKATVPASYRSGMQVSGGAWNSQLLFVSAGLASKWAHAAQREHGRAARLFNRLPSKHQPRAVLFDEAHIFEEDASYAALFMAALEFAAHPSSTMSIVLATATPSPGVRALAARGRELICVERPFPVSMYRWPVATDSRKDQSWPACASTAMHLYDLGYTSLIFVATQQDVESMCKHLRDRGIPESAVFPFHAGVSKDDRQRAKRAYDFPRIVVATSLAEKALTIVDVSYVLDLGVSRIPYVENGIEGLGSTRVTLASCEQRAGRSGRVRPGCYLLFGDIAIARTAHADPSSIDTLAVMDPKVACDPLFPCTVDASHLQRRREELLALFPGNDENSAIAAIGALACSVKHAATLQHAKQQDLVAAAAVLITCVETGTWPQAKNFSLLQMYNRIAEVTKAKEQYKCLVDRMDVRMWQSDPRKY